MSRQCIPCWNAVVCGILPEYSLLAKVSIIQVGKRQTPDTPSKEKKNDSFHRKFQTKVQYEYFFHIFSQILYCHNCKSISNKELSINDSFSHEMSRLVNVVICRLYTQLTSLHTKLFFNDSMQTLEVQPLLHHLSKYSATHLFKHLLLSLEIICVNCKEL